MLGALGSHFVDTLRWWFGEISEVAGAAAATVPIPWHGGNRESGAAAEDTFTMLLRFASGAMGTITCSAAAWHGPGEEIRAFGSEGMLTIALDGTLWGGRYDDAAPVPIADSGAAARERHPRGGRHTGRATRSFPPSSASPASGRKGFSPAPVRLPPLPMACACRRRSMPFIARSSSTSGWTSAARAGPSPRPAKKLLQNRQDAKKTTTKHRDRAENTEGSEKKNSVSCFSVVSAISVFSVLNPFFSWRPCGRPLGSIGGSFPASFATRCKSERVYWPPSGVGTRR